MSLWTPAASESEDSATEDEMEKVRQDDWVSMVDEYGHRFFWNRCYQTSRWDMPPGTLPPWVRLVWGSLTGEVRELPGAHVKSHFLTVVVVNVIMQRQFQRLSEDSEGPAVQLITVVYVPVLCSFKTQWRCRSRSSSGLTSM